jgi:hypothetical protein
VHVALAYAGSGEGSDHGHKSTALPLRQGSPSKEHLNNINEKCV